MIKLITDKKHRFGKYILIKNKNMFVSPNGEIEVEENLVTYALEAGFELVDKDAKFISREEEVKIKEVNDILSSAKQNAEEIIKEAHREADKIIMEAKKAANIIIEDSGIEEKQEFESKLKDRKVEELREVLASSDNYDKETISKMKKQELIDAIMKIRYE